MEERVNKSSFNNIQNTTNPSIVNNFKRKWYLIDLKEKNIGRESVKISSLLRGKKKFFFIPNFDLGDYVVLINASFLKFSKKKMLSKNFYDHSGYPGGLRKRSLKVMNEKYSTELVFRIVKGMMPHNVLSRKQLKRLFIFKGEHNLKAQEKNFIKL